MPLADLVDQRTQARDTVVIVRLFEVDSAGDLGMHRRAAQLFRIGLLPDRGLHQRRAGEKQA